MGCSTANYLCQPPSTLSAVSFKYLIVDDHWTHIGWFESAVPDWSIGQEFVLADGRRLAITGIVPNPKSDADYQATWTAEPA